MDTGPVISAAALLFAGSALLFAAGCGGQDPTPEARNAAAAVEDFAGAYLERNGEAACDLLTPGAQEELHAAFLAADPGEEEITDCASAIGSLDRDAAAAAGGVTVESLTIAGATATAIASDGERRVEVALERTDGGGWLVSEPRELVFGAAPG